MNALSTKLLDAAIEEAVTSARSLGANVQRVAPVSLSVIDQGTTSETIRTDVVTYKGQKGFKVTGTLSIGTFSVSRYVQSLPESKTTAWPENLATEAAAWPAACLIAAEKHVELQGFTATRLVTLLNAYLVKFAATGNNPSVLAASNPKLAAVYAWTQSVQAAAATGSKQFPPAPFTFASVIEELHA